MFGASADYSRWTARDWILARIQSVLDYIANPDTVLFSITSWIGDTIIRYGLQPLHNFLALTPWFIVLAGFTAIALVVSGWRPALRHS